MLIYLPHILEEPFPYVRLKQEQFSPETTLANLEIIRVRLGDTEEVRYVTELVNEYAPYLAGVQSSDWINALLEADVTINQPTPLGDYQSLVGRLVPGSNTTVLLSDTHTTTGPTLRECKRINPGKSYSVLCLDAHADIYSTHEPLWKGNVFSCLIEEGVVFRLLVLGVPQQRIDNVLSDTPRHIRERVGFADPGVDGNIQHMLEWLTEGADEVFVSIDPDGLNTHEAIFTAMEYCPFQILLSLGTVSLTDLDQAAVANAFEQALRPPGHPMTNGIQTRKNLFRIGESGLSIADAETVIGETRILLSSRGKELGISIGDGHLVGDIVELYGLDLYGNTTAAVRALHTVLTLD